MLTETGLGLGYAVAAGRDGALSQFRRSSARTISVAVSDMLNIQAAAMPADNRDRSMKSFRDKMV